MVKVHLSAQEVVACYFGNIIKVRALEGAVEVELTVHKHCTFVDFDMGELGESFKVVAYELCKSVKGNMVEPWAGAKIYILEGGLREL